MSMFNARNNVIKVSNPSSDTTLFQQRNGLRSKSLEDLYGSENLKPLFTTIAKSIKLAISSNDKKDFRHYLTKNYSHLFGSKTNSEIIEMANVALVLHPPQIIKICQDLGVNKAKIPQVLKSELDGSLRFKLITNQY